MKKMSRIFKAMAIFAIAFAACNNNPTPKTAEEAVENSIYSSSEDVFECRARLVQRYRVNGTTVATECDVMVSQDGKEYARTTRWAWWDQNARKWEVGKDLHDVVEWQRAETARRNALREWADTL